MIYEEYHEFKIKYYQAQKKYDEILSEKERLFIKTQPKSINLDKERVSGGMAGNSFDEYLIAKEEKRIDEILEETKLILKDRKHLIELKEEELRSSNNIQDKIYTYRYIDKMKIHKITRLVDYSEAQIYRILRTIKNNLKDDRK